MGSLWGGVRAIVPPDSASKFSRGGKRKGTARTAPSTARPRRRSRTPASALSTMGVVERQEHDVGGGYRGESWTPAGAADSTRGGLIGSKGRPAPSQPAVRHVGAG